MPLVAYIEDAAMCSRAVEALFRRIEQEDRLGLNESLTAFILRSFFSVLTRCHSSSFLESGKEMTL